MAEFIVRNSGVVIATVTADTPENAAVTAFEREFKRIYEVSDAHGPNWGGGSDRINGNGAENLDHCADVYLGDQHVARIEMREVDQG